MTAVAHDYPIVQLSMGASGSLSLTTIDRDYIIGAFLERQAIAAAEGVIYEWPDFLRMALLNEAHHS